MFSIAIPILFVISLYKIISIRYYLKKAGEKIVSKQNNNDIKWLYVFIILNIISFSIALVILIIEAKLLFNTIFVIIILLGFITIFIFLKIYEKMNGIYTNGIINGKFISWDKINSFKWIDNMQIYFYLKSGKVINLGNVYEKNKIIEILQKNQLIED